MEASVVTDPFVLGRLARHLALIVVAALAASVGTVAGADAPVDPLACPDGLAVDAAGTLYVADVCTNRVLARSSEGVWRVFAGTGEPGYAGDGGPADQAQLEYVAGVTLDDAGNVYIIECGGNVVRRVTADGTISTVAGVGGRGAGQGGYSGDGGPATEAELACPSDAAIDPSGQLHITDRENSVVRRADASGMIETIAGGGSIDTATASANHQGPATDARFAPESPVQVVIDAAGNLYLADEPAHRVWRVDPSGTITSFAGTGQPGFSGDGGPAAEAQLNGPYGLAVDAQDNLYIGDYENGRIRRVGPDGIITTVAGNGEVGTAGDGGPATDAQLQSPYGLAVDEEGALYIADQENARIRVVDPAGIIDTLPADG
jgi:sugar lactone lactonase YvrE